MSDKKPKVLFDLPWKVQQGEVGTVFTSKIYPIEADDRLALTWEVDRARLMPGHTDEMDITFNVESLNLRPLLQSYSLEEEGLDLDFDVSSLELRVALKEHTIEEEGLDLDFDIASLALEPKLVSHEQPEEGLQLDWAVTTLELSP